jgi:mono/diheme cytochrome c family protein
MKTPHVIVRALPLPALLLLQACATATAPPPATARGEYLAKIMDCGGCHTPGALAGKPDFTARLAGSSIGFRVPGVGVLYPPNLTPDPATGLGRWTTEQIVRAVRHGERPDGRRLVPVMPWPTYSALTDADATALATYLKSLPPLPGRAPANTPEGTRPPAPYLDMIIPC